MPPGPPRVAGVADQQAADRLADAEAIGHHDVRLVANPGIPRRWRFPGCDGAATRLDPGQAAHDRHVPATSTIPTLRSCRDRRRSANTIRTSSNGGPSVPDGPELLKGVGGSPAILASRPSITATTHPVWPTRWSVISSHGRFRSGNRAVAAPQAGQEAGSPRVPEPPREPAIVVHAVIQPQLAQDARPASRRT